jgi:N6-adenosine-specific RNA methylase IME4
MSETELSRQDKIYKKFKELKIEAENVVKLDTYKMSNAFNNSSDIVRWITKKTEWSRVLRDLEVKRKKAYRIAYEYYQTEFALKLTTKDEYILFIESDENYVNHMQLSLLVKEVIQFIDSTIDALKTKGYDIKNLIEWRKFTNGQ